MPFNEKLFEILVGFAVAIGAGLVFYWYSNRKQVPTTAESQPINGDKSESRKLQLQAYERLTLLADRIALPNL